MDNLKKLVFFIFTIVSIAAMQLFAMAAPPDYNDLEKVKSVDAVVSGSTAKASLAGNAGETINVNAPLQIKDGTNVTQFAIKLKNNVTGGSISITPIDQPSVTAPPGSIGFFKVDLEGLTDDDIESAEIIFKVGNNLVSVQLHRLSNGTWAALPTSRVEAGANESTYKANSPGFSEFAITAQQGSVQSTSTGKLPFTGGAPLYLVGGLGLILIASGLALRVKGTK